MTQLIDYQINLIVAYSIGRVIGRDNKLLWHLADDMAFFKTTTTGKVVVMGRKTYESLPQRFRPLPNRVNIVLSNQGELEKKDSLYWVKNLEEIYGVLNRLDCKELFIIGGGQIYELFLPLSDVIYATEVEAALEGDTFFPELNKREWESTIMESHLQDKKNDFNYKILKYTRKKLV